MAEIINSQDELNDILIRRDDGSGGVFKNVLLVIAAIVLIVIIVFLAMRVISATGEISKTDVSGAPETPGEQPTMFVPPQPVVTDPAQVRNSIDEIIERHRKAREQEQNATPIAADPAETKQPIAAATPQTPPKKETPPPPKVEPAAAVPKVVEPKPVVKQEPTTVKQETKASASAALFFIQIEALEKPPRDEYLKTLRSHGINVVVKPRVVDGKNLHKILVGPYESRKQAEQNLQAIRRDFNGESFVVQETL